MLQIDCIVCIKPAHWCNPNCCKQLLLIVSNGDLSKIDPHLILKPQSLLSNVITQVSPRKEDKCLIINSSVQNQVIISVKHKNLNCAFLPFVFACVYDGMVNCILSSAAKTIFPFE